MKKVFRWTDPGYNFILGASLNQGISTDADGNEEDVTLLSVGFLFFEVTFIW